MQTIVLTGCYKRAAKTVYHLFRINRLELELLCSMSNSLVRRKVVVLGIQGVLADWLTSKYYGQIDKAVFYSLHTLGMIEKHKHRVKGYNYSITALGRNVLKYYEECMCDEVSKIVGDSSDKK